MKRLAVALLCFAFLAAPPAEAQSTGKMYRIGYLGGGSLASVPHLVEAFRQGLRELGWVEGRNVVIQYRWAEGKPDRWSDLASELGRSKVDVIVAGTTVAALAAKQVTRTIPIVFAVSGDPVATGLIAGLAQPGGNITGLTNISPELSGKRLEILKEVVPGLARVAILRNADNPPGALQFKEMEVAARALGVQLKSLEVRGPNPDFDGAFQTAIKWPAGGLVVLQDFLTVSHRTRMVALVGNRLPTISEFGEFAEAGGLMSYGPSLPDLFRRAATYVDKILKGAKPADLPVEQPTKFELVINCASRES